jgi:membrane-bound ClpP family serine protease
MNIEGLIFLVIGVILCVIGAIYATDWMLVGMWVGGFIMILVSVVIMFPQRKGVSIE